MAARVAASSASRSKTPALRRAETITFRKRATSQAISFWTARTVFFDQLVSVRQHRRTLPADGQIDVQQLAGQLLEFTVGGDLTRGLAARGLVRQALGDGLAAALVGEAPVGAVAGLAGLVAVAGRLAATAAGGGDRAGTEVPEGQQTLEQGVALGFELVEGRGHSPCVYDTQGLAMLH